MSSRLGKGFGALFSADPKLSNQEGEPLSVPLGRISTNPKQPRKDFSPSSLEELAASIREKGVIQPIIVERLEGGDFVIVAGERRYRAAKIAGLEEIPVFLRSVPNEDRIEVALIENIQRTDLSPLEEAMAYSQLMEAHGYTQEEVAKKVGKQRSTVANAVRLLKLPTLVREFLEQGIITSGHARAILVLENEKDQIQLAKDIEAGAWSVRVAEREADLRRKGKSSVVSAVVPEKPESSVPRGTSELPPDWKDIQNRLMEKYGTKVEIKGGERGGVLEMRYYSIEDLNRLAELLMCGSA